jgi:hypothetical protein
MGFTLRHMRQNLLPEQVRGGGQCPLKTSVWNGSRSDLIRNPAA